MPNIDKFSVKEKYRAWDSDILSKLKIPNNNLSSNQTDKNVATTSDKQATNRRQTSDKVVTNRRQSGDRLIEKKEALVTKCGQTTPQTSDTTDDKPVTNWRQNDTNSSFTSLAGLQRYIIIFIYNLCKISRDKKTNEVSITQLAHYCNSTIKSVKRSIFRLIEKGIVIRDGFKNGRGGWTIYYLPNDIYQEIMSIETSGKLMTNWRQTGDKLPTQLPPKVMTGFSSSGGIDIKTTTTGAAENLIVTVIPEEWKNLDIEPLNQIGFTVTHLNQIASQNKLSPQIVQDSIYAFAFDLENNAKAKTIKGDPINYFMGVLRNGKPYTPSSNYESPQDKTMRLYLERKREIEQRRAGMEKEALTLAFNEWFDALSNERKKEFLPEVMRKGAGGARLENNKFLKSSAWNHFEVEIWPNQRNEIFLQPIATKQEEVTEGK